MRVIFALVVLVLTGCSAVPDSFACAHCACSTGERTVSRPLLCSTMQRDLQCCAIFFGS